MIPALPARYHRGFEYRSGTPYVSDIRDELYELSAAWFGQGGLTMRRIGAGSYGTVFALHVTPAMREIFRPTFESPEFVHTVGRIDAVPVSVPIAMKIVLLPRGTNARGSYMSMLREMRVHWALCHVPPKQLGGKVYDIASVIPTLYAAGYDRRARAAVFFMEHMHGYSIHTIARPPFPPIVLVHIEYALACLFLNGFVHVDFHPGNMFYDTRTGRVKIFDFAFAATLHPTSVSRFAWYLQTHGVHAIDAFWRDVGEMHGNAAVLARSRTFPGAPTAWYRNVSVLAALQGMVHDIPALTRLRWMVWVPEQLRRHI